MQRKLFKDIEKHISKKEFTILTGARQTGKSTLMRQLDEDCKSKGIPTVFLNLENKVILSELDKHPFNMLNYLQESEQRVVAFLDEVQYLEDPSNFLKLLYDEYADKIKIVATGSSAFYIDDHFRDSLAGRKRVFQMYTCSFEEYLELSNKMALLEELKTILKKKNARSIQINLLQNEWEMYMRYGGYPAVITEPDNNEKVNKLREIRDSFVKRDILESGVQNETAFYNLFKLLAAQSGNLVNVNELAVTLRIKNDTVNNYLTILQKCFHVALVKPFHRNVRKELVKMPKAYLLDTGMRNCLLNNFQSTTQRTDKGELWENQVFRILLEKYTLDEIQFWRTAEGNEVDFVLTDLETPFAIEVKYDQSLIKPSKYKKFKEAYPEIPLQFAWMEPFEEDFFRRIFGLE